jgi:PKD repeat protein
LSFGEQVDPSAADIAAGLRYSYDCEGDGAFEVADVAEASFTCSYVDDGTFAARGRIADKDAGFTDYTAQVTVANVAPIVGAITPVDPLEVRTTASVRADFSDLGVADTHTATWDWGDGSISAGDVVESNGSGAVSGQHIYSAAGVYTLKLMVRDKDDLTGESTFQYVVIYDPAAGYVIGRGSIDSPAGAYVPSPALSGKAVFGFQARYQKGATVPSGHTQFRFRVADMDFRSTAYDWLVVAGSKAQYKGGGTINGGGAYGFILTATDRSMLGGGGVDTFRIKIWDKTNGAVIYDNQPGDADTAEPATAVEDGKITIHTK